MIHPVVFQVVERLRAVKGLLGDLATRAAAGEELLLEVSKSPPNLMRILKEFQDFRILAGTGRDVHGLLSGNEM